MSTARKRRANLPDTEKSKPVKKSKKTPDKECDSLRVEVRSSERDSGCPTPETSLNECATPKRKKGPTSKNVKAAKKSKKSVQKYEEQDIKSLNVSQLLDLGEGRNCESQETLTSSDWGGSSDSEEEDWEEVKMEVKEEPKDPVIPKEGVNITVEVPGLNHFRRKKKGFDLEAHIRRQMNQVKRELQLLIHKVHVLCWIAHLKFVNTVLNSETLMGVSLSLITNKNLYPPKYSDLGYLERIVKWFHTVIKLSEHLKNPVQTKDLTEQLCHQFSLKVAYTKKHFVFMLIVLCRTLGLKTRLVMSFQVVPVRPKNSELPTGSKSNQDGEGVVKKETTEKDVPGTKDPIKKSIEGEVKIVKVENKYFSNKNAKETGDKAKTKKKEEEPVINKNSSSKVTKRGPKCKNMKEDKSGGGSTSAAKSDNTVNKKKVLKKQTKSVLQDSDSDEGEISKHFRSSPEKGKKFQVGKQKKTDNNSNKNSANSSSTPVQERPSSNRKESPLDQTPKVKGKLAVIRGKAKMERIGGKQGPVKKIVNKPKSTGTPGVKNKIIEKADASSDTDSDFVPQSLKKPSPSEVDRRVFSSDEEDQDSKKRKGVDVWAEIFLEAEEKWISVDAVRMKIHCINELYSRATQPVVYVVACNNNSTMKDVTKRYVPNWHSDTRKRRVDEVWWNETMWPYLGPKTAQDKEEDEDINSQMMDKPLPAVISEYKDHPLYALKRHLLKFEGIYPPDAPALGFIRKEPVYARECVVTLRSREVWYKEARVVRLGEQPYKIVKARPKYDKMTGEFKKDLPLELFGIWQTEEFIPPVAKDGKVPRNEYGNVDLFKPCMLPKGTVHLQIPALNKVAKKLGIDCAAAVVGFEFHSGASHPLVDGFVVCEEFKEVLLDAWNKEIDESNKKNEEKRLKRIYDNWKRLIRGLLIREKLKAKYAFGDEGSDAKATTSGRKSAKKK